MSSRAHASASPHASSLFARKREMLNISIEDFKAGMEKFAMMFTGNYGVKLVFRGASAYTNGKLIVVPELSLLSRPNMTEKEIDEALDFLMCTRGFVYHEGAHIIFSGDIKRIVQDALNHGGPKFKHLWNVLEDLRIEYSIAQLYPGAKEALVFMNDWLMDRIAENTEQRIAKGEKLTPFAQTCYAIGLLGTLSGRGVDHKMWSLLSDQTREYVASIRGMVMRARHAASPKVVYKIAVEIWEHLKDEEKRRQEEKKRQRDEERAKQKAKEKSDEEQGEGDGEGGEDEEESTGKKKSKKKRKDKKPKKPVSAPVDEDDAEGDDDADSGDDDDAGDGSSGDEELHEESDEGDESSGDAGDDDSDSDGDANGGHGDDDGDGSGSAESEDGDEEPAPELDEDEKLVGDEGDASDVSEEKEDTIKRKMEEEVKSLLATGERRYRVYSTEYDTIGPPPKPYSDQELQRLRMEVQKIDAETRFAYGPVKRQLENLLKAMTHSYYVHGLEDGELDPAALHKLASAARGGPQIRQQARHVFQQKVEVRSLKSTAVEIVIDVSGSMGCAGRQMSMWRCPKCSQTSEHMVHPYELDLHHYYPGLVRFPKSQDLECPHCNKVSRMDVVTEPVYEQKVSLARKCAIVFAHALEGVHVPFDMFTWTTGDFHTSERQLQAIQARSKQEYEDAKKLFARFGALSIMDIKRFDEKWQPVQWRLAHVHAQNCNYDGESVLHGARRLMQRQEKRKVMFVLCDGIPGPCVGEDHARHRQYLHDVVKEIRSTTPIELIGIGIGAPEAAEFYNPRFVNVMNASELPSVCIQQLKRVLLT